MVDLALRAMRDSVSFSTVTSPSLFSFIRTGRHRMLERESSQLGHGFRHDFNSLVLKDTHPLPRQKPDSLA